MQLQSHNLLGTHICIVYLVLERLRSLGDKNNSFNQAVWNKAHYGLKVCQETLHFVVGLENHNLMIIVR